MNLQTTHPKVKLAPWCYRPFKVIWASPTNCKLQLPEWMKIHPVFYNLLLKPYHEIQAHGPNFERPPPEIVEGEEGHYEIDKILAARPTWNRKSTQYFVHWKGYTDADNSWIPAGELTHAKELIAEFHAQQRSKEGIHIQALQVQGDPKEGILSQAKLTPTRNAFPNNPRTYSTDTSHFITTPTPSSNQVISRTHDCGNLSHDPSRDKSRDLPDPNMSCDLTACDPGNVTHDQPKSWSSNMSQDHTRFGRMTCLLINTWKTVGRINKHVTIDQSTKTQLIGVMPQWKTWDNLQSSTATHPLYLYLP